MKRIRPLNQEKREAILKAAIEEFYTKGFEGSSMDTISKLANVSKATVYNHFKNKEELFLSVATIIRERIEESFKYTYSNIIDIKTQLKQIAKKEMNFLNSKDNMKLIQIITIVMIQKNEIGLKLLEIFEDDCMIMTSQWFQDAKIDGKLDFESSHFVSKQFVGMLKSFAFLPQLYGSAMLSKEEENKVIEEAVYMILKLYKK